MNGHHHWHLSEKKGLEACEGSQRAKSIAGFKKKTHICSRSFDSKTWKINFAVRR
jgi:hypothetical protein